MRKYKEPEPFRDIHAAAELLPSTPPENPPEPKEKFSTVRWWLSEGYTHLLATCQDSTCYHHEKLELTDYKPMVRLEEIGETHRCTKCGGYARVRPEPIDRTDFKDMSNFHTDGMPWVK